MRDDVGDDEHGNEDDDGDDCGTYIIKHYVFPSFTCQEPNNRYDVFKNAKGSRRDIPKDSVPLHELEESRKGSRTDTQKLCQQQKKSRVRRKQTTTKRARNIQCKNHSRVKPCQALTPNDEISVKLY